MTTFGSVCSGIEAASVASKKCTKCKSNKTVGDYHKSSQPPRRMLHLWHSSPLSGDCNMRYLSLFSGIEAASATWESLGFEPVAFAEFDAFPSAVLAHRFPRVCNLGDVTKITEEHIKSLGRIDIVVFGSPCQDLSVAGLRKGFSGERSGLFHVAIRIVQWARKHCGCRFALWENVFGAFSSNQGRDFAAVVEQMAGCRDVAVPPHGWGSEGAAVGDNGLLEWGTLDAQWFGVAQRRRRVFALADFGDWTNRPPILLEPHRLRRDTPPRRGKGPTVAALTANGVGTCGADDNQGQAGHLIPAAGCWWDGGQVSQTLDAVLAKGQTMPEKNCFPAVLQPIAFHPTQDPHVAYTVSLRGREGGATAELGDEVGGCLRASGGGGDKAHVLAPVGVTVHGTDPTVRKVASYDDLAQCLRARTPGNIDNSSTTVVQQEKAVRRLTPTECERLMGFPDDWTLVPVRGKPAADGPRYKAIGNSMAVPVMRWIGERIKMALEWRAAA